MILEKYFDPDQELPAGNGWIIPARGHGGIVSGASMEHYAAFRGLNSGLLKHYTAADMWHGMHEPAEDHFGSESAALKWTIGIIVHWAVLEQWKFAEFDKHTVMSPTIGLATKKAQDVRAAYPNKLVITPELIDQAHQCYLAIRMHPGAQFLLGVDDAEREVSGFHFDADFRVWKKIRVDFAPRAKNYFVDVKTTARDLDKSFEYDCKKFGYHLQAAHYLDTWEQITGQRRDTHYLIAVTKEPPFKCRIYDYQNFPRNHPMYDQSPIASARNTLGTRQAIWLTAAHETLSDVQQGLTLTPDTLRKNWPAHENDQPFSTTLVY